MPEAEPDSRGRLPAARPVAVVDIGSNSIRLVVYERLSRALTPLFNEKSFAALGTGVAETGAISPDAYALAEATLRRFAVLLAQLGVADVTVLATAAAREARNGAGFLKMVEATLGHAPLTLDGDEEARVSAYGVIAGINDPLGIAGDLGGGSLELTEIRNRAVGRRESMKLGVLRLKADSRASLKEAEGLVRRALDASDVVGRMRGADFYAVGGTWRALARLHMQQTGYPLQVMHSYAIDARDMAEFLKPLARGAVQAASGIEVVSKARQALLAYGATALKEILRAGRPARVVVSALGLREGHLFLRLSEPEQQADPLIAAARELGLLRSRSARHCEELVDFTAQALRALAIRETDEEARLRTAVCHLADIGWRAHPDYRGVQSFNIIANAGFVGIDHPGRAFLAVAVHFRYAGLSGDDLSPSIREMVPIRYLERARAVAAAMRVAYVLSAAAPGVLPLIRWRRAAGRLVLHVPPELEGLVGPRVEARLQAFAALGNLAGAVLTGAAKA